MNKALRLKYARQRLTDYMIRRAARVATEMGFGYVEHELAPESLYGMKLAVNNARKYGIAYPVLSLYSDNTIYLNREANWAFRFVHDMFHVALNAGTDSLGEYEVARAMAVDIWATFGGNSDEAALYWADTCGQSDYFEKHGCFPDDQLAFVVSLNAERFELPMPKGWQSVETACLA